MARKILGILTGYAIFVISSVLWFRITGQAPHGPASWGFMGLTLVYGSVFSCCGGYLTALIGACTNLNTNYILAVLLAGFAAFSAFASNGEHWTQLMAIFIFAPMTLLGGYYYLKTKKN